MADKPRSQTDRLDVHDFGSDIFLDRWNHGADLARQSFCADGNIEIR